MAEMDRVIVVGGGPVGFVAALRLAEMQIPVLLLEAGQMIERDLRASTFHPPTLDMLDSYGISDELVARGRITPTWQVRLHATGERAEFDLGKIKKHTGHPYRLQCEQWKISEAAYERLKAYPHAEVRFGARVIGIEQDDDSVTVKVQTEEGMGRESALWVIGADGSKSAIRDLLEIPFDGKIYPETTILATTRFPFEKYLDGLSGVNYVWGNKGTFSLLQLPDLWRCSVYAKEGESSEEAIRPDRIREKLNEITPEFGDAEIMEIRPYRIHRRVVDHYRRGRIVLCGDAAHLNSPSGGMGMNGGVHDAFNLTEKLGQIWRGEGDPALLDQYSRQRKLVAVEEVQEQAEQNRNRMQQKDPEERRKTLLALQKTAKDPELCEQYLLKTSMITGLRRAASVD